MFIIEFITLIVAILIVILFGENIANKAVHYKERKVDEYTSVKVRKME